MEGIQNSPSSADEEVLLFHGDEVEGVQQPGPYRCCTRGIQLYNRREVQPYELVEFTLEFPNSMGIPEQFSCTGVVAQCHFDDAVALFYVAVKFLGLPTSAKRRIAALTPSDHHPCPFCENC